MKKTSYWIYSCLKGWFGWVVSPLLGGGDHWFDSCQIAIFTIQNILQCAVGNVKLAKKLRSGAVLVEVDSPSLWRSERCQWRPGLMQKSKSHRINLLTIVAMSWDAVIFETVMMLGWRMHCGVKVSLPWNTSRQKKDNKLQPTNTFILTFISVNTEVY